MASIQDDDFRVLEVVPVTVVEGNSGQKSTTVTVPLLKDGVPAPLGNAVTFNWALASGTAASPADFVAASGSGTILPDGDVEGDETIFLHQTSLEGATRANASAPAVGTIKNLAISTFRPIGKNFFLVKFATGRGQQYLLETTDSLESGEWQPVTGLMTGSGAEIQWQQYCDAPACFFRLKVESLPPQ